MVSTRTLVRLCGLGLLVLGGVLALGSAIVHLAWALPLAELVLRPAVVEGEVIAAFGVALWSSAGRRPAGGRTDHAVRAPESPLRLAS